MSSTKEAKELDIYMRSNYEGQNTTNWKLFCGFWESSCFDKEFRYDKINQPNYSSL